MELLKWFRLQWDRVTGVGAMATGGVLLLVCWSKVSGTPYTAEQIPYVVSCGLGGLFLLGVGATVWHSADLRDQWRKLDRLEERFDIVLGTTRPATTTTTPAAPTTRTTARPAEALASPQAR